MVYVKVDESIHTAIISGRMQDKEWDNRECKMVTIRTDFATMDSLLTDGTPWSIVIEDEVITTDEEGNEVTETRQTEYDNSEFSIRGDLTVHVDGTCTVKMGKLTELEEAYEIMLGGI